MADLSPNQCEEIKVPRALKRGFPLLNNTHAVGTPCNRDPSSNALQQSEEGTEKMKGQKWGPKYSLSAPGPRGNASCGVAQGTLPAVATSAAGLTTLASILLRRRDLPSPAPENGGRPRSEPGPALARALPKAGLWRRRNGPARPRAGSRAAG